MISVPFHGSKKTSYKYIKEIVKEYEYSSVYEPFGGSGVLSVNLYKDGLVNKAVINDYDRFFDDYEQYLDYKDWIVKNCEAKGFHRTMCNSSGIWYYKGGKRIYLKTQLLPDHQKQYLQSLVKQIPEKYWRYLSLGSNFCFPSVIQHKEVKINDFKYFNAYLKTDKQREYLKWINRVYLDSIDYNEFLEKYSSEFTEKSLLIIDPPYIVAYQFAYKGQFTLEETRQLILNLKRLKVDFIFFNSNEEIVQELLEGLNISFIRKARTTGKSSISNRPRNDCFALVRFNKNENSKQKTD